MFSVCQIRVNQKMQNLYDRQLDVLINKIYFHSLCNLSTKEYEEHREELYQDNISDIRIIVLEDPWSDLPYDLFKKENTSKEMFEGDFEKIAWYRSYHYIPQEKWGIYVKIKGIQSVVNSIVTRYASNFGEELPLSLETLIQFAYELILSHEHLHFFVDFAASTLELTKLFEASDGLNLRTDDAKKLLAHELGVEVFTRMLYLKYMFQYSNERKGSDETKPHEEALANAFAYRCIPYFLKEKYGLEEDVCIKISSVIHEVKKRAPNGYKSFDLYLTDEEFFNGCQEMMKCFSESGLWNYKLLWPQIEDLFKYKVPVYLVLGGS